MNARRKRTYRETVEVTFTSQGGEEVGKIMAHVAQLALQPLPALPEPLEVAEVPQLPNVQRPLLGAPDNNRVPQLNHRSNGGHS